MLDILKENMPIILIGLLVLGILSIFYLPNSAEKLLLVIIGGMLAIANVGGNKT